MNLTIDASVFVSAARPSEESYAMSNRFLQQAKGLNIFCPVLIIPECGAAIARPTGDPGLSRRMVSLVGSFPGMNLVSLDSKLAFRAAEIAIQHHLRGADAVYIAVADAFGAAP